MDKLREVINDVLQQSLMDTSTVNHYTTLLAERIAREFCLNEHQLADQLLADKQRLEVGLETAKQIIATLKSDIDELIDQRDNGGGIWGKLTARALDERDQLRRELDEARKALTSDYYKNLADKLEAELREKNEYLRAPVGMEMMKRIAALEAKLAEALELRATDSVLISRYGRDIKQLQSLIRKLDTCLYTAIWNAQATAEEQELLRKVVEEK